MSGARLVSRDEELVPAVTWGARRAMARSVRALERSTSGGFLERRYRPLDWIRQS